MRVDDATWAAIENAYTGSTESMASMARRLGVATSTIRRGAKLKGWSRPDKRAAEPSDGAPLQRPETRRDADIAEVRIRRLFRVIDLQLDHMERHMSMSEPMTAQDQERQARAVSATIGNLEKAMDAANEVLKTGPRAEGETGHAGAAEAARMRREIAERLERLSERWLSGSKPE